MAKQPYIALNALEAAAQHAPNCAFAAHMLLLVSTNRLQDLSQPVSCSCKYKEGQGEATNRD